MKNNNVHDEDELISQRTTVHGNTFDSDHKRYRRVIAYGDGKSRIFLPCEGYSKLCN